MPISRPLTAGWAASPQQSGQTFQDQALSLAQRFATVKPAPVSSMKRA